MARVLILLPSRDFDPSEAAVSWQLLVNAGHVVAFATPDGHPAVADDMMLTGQGLDFWGRIPLLRNWPLIGLLMRANRDAREAYAGMIADPNYGAPYNVGIPSMAPHSMGCCCPADIARVACVITSRARRCSIMSSASSRRRNLWRRSVTACYSPRAAFRG